MKNGEVNIKINQKQLFSLKFEEKKSEHLDEVQILLLWEWGIGKKVGCASRFAIITIVCVYPNMG